MGLIEIDGALGVLGKPFSLCWSFKLLKSSAWELLDGRPPGFLEKHINEELHKKNMSVHHIKIWKITPRHYACELTLHRNDHHEISTTALEHQIKEIFMNHYFPLGHLSVNFCHQK